MTEKDFFLSEVNVLIKKYQQRKSELGEKGLKEIGEANVRKDFIDPFFKILDWKIDDSREYDSEKFVRGKGHVDIALKSNQVPLIFIEAKKFGGVPSRLDRGIQLTLTGHKIYADWTEEERQVLNYAGMSLNVKWAILTNFEKFRLFNAKTGEIVLNVEVPNEYLERIDDFILLSKDQVIIGNINKLESRLERPDIDLNFLFSLNDWRLKLARNIHKTFPQLNLSEIKKYVQRILDRFVIIRYAEDAWILKEPDQLQAAYEYWSKTRMYTSLTDIIKQLFIGFNQIHDSGIFEEDKELDNILAKIENEVLGEIIQALYSQNFRKFTSDILGNTYESYLGHELFLKDGEIEIKQNPILRKAGGIYYTQPPVVDYIIKNTLGEKTENILQKAISLLNDDKIQESYLEFDKIKKLRILDPACGSGSFLIKSYRQLKNTYGKYNEKIDEENRKLTEKITQLRKTGENKEAWSVEFIRPQKNEDFEKQIIYNNIFGVDLDSSAAEIAAVNILLQGLKKGEKLPLILKENIKIGNSIIGANDDELKKFFGDYLSEMKPFKWEENFKTIYNEGLFDIIIGNPPYYTISTQPDIVKKYFEESSEWSTVYRGQNDILFYFIMRGLQLLKDGGLLGFIVARYWLESKWADRLRNYLLNNAKIKIILDSGNIQFFAGANVLTSIIILEKDTNQESRLNNKVKIIKVKKWDENFINLFQHVLENQTKDYYEDEFVTIFNTFQRNLTDDPWMFDPPIIDELKEKIRKDTWMLGDICNIGQGMTTGLNSAFIVQPEIISMYKIENTILRRYVKTRDIKRYFINYRNLYMIYSVHGVDQNNIKNTLKYLEKYKMQLEERYPYKKGVCEWYELSVLRNRELFENSEEKILVPNYATSNKFAYDNKNYYTLTDTYVIVSKVKDISLKYVIGILNSRLMNFYYKTITKLKRDEYMEYFTRPLSEIPIKKIDINNPVKKSIYDSIIIDVEKIIELIEKRSTLNLDFNRYIGDPIIGEIKFRTIYDEISPSDRDADKTTNGKIKKVKVIEENDWIRFNVNYTTIDKKENIEVEDHTVIKCRIIDEAIRKYILFYINHNWKSLGTGNLLSKILNESIPLFNTKKSSNLEIMRKISKEYMKALEKGNELDTQLYNINSNLDKKIYDLYEINDKECKLIESITPEPALILEPENENVNDLPDDI